MKKHSKYALGMRTGTTKTDYEDIAENGLISKKKHIAHRLLSILIVTSLLFATFIGAYNLGLSEKQSTINSVAQRNRELLTSNSKLKSDNESLEEEVNRLREEVATLISVTLSPQPTVKTTQPIIANPSTVKKNTTESVEKEPVAICAFKNCTNELRYGDNNYCWKHSCSEFGCIYPICNIRSRYCLYHKCAVADCYSGKSINSNYCLVHQP